MTAVSVFVGDTTKMRFRVSSRIIHSAIRLERCFAFSVVLFSARDTTGMRFSVLSRTFSNSRYDWNEFLCSQSYFFHFEIRLKCDCGNLLVLYIVQYDRNEFFRFQSYLLFVLGPITSSSNTKIKKVPQSCETPSLLILCAFSCFEITPPVDSLI